MTSCERFLPHFSEYLEGTIPVQLKAEFEAHLRGCENCRNTLHRMQMLQSRLQNLPVVRTSNAFHIVLRSRIRHELERPTLWERLIDSLQMNRIPAYAAAAVLLLAISYGSARFFFHSGSTTQKQASPVSMLESQAVPGALVVQKHGSQVEERIHFILDEVPAGLLTGEGAPLSSKGLQAFRKEERISQQDSAGMVGTGTRMISVRKAATVTF